MSNVIKIFAAVFICAAGIFLYVVSFSLEAFFSLIVLGVLIVLQISFLSRRAEVKQYKNSESASNFAESPPDSHSSDLNIKEPEIQTDVSADQNLREEPQSSASEAPNSHYKKKTDDKILESFKTESPPPSPNAQNSKAEAAPIPKDARKQLSDRSVHEAQVFQNTLENLIMKVQKCLSRKKYKEGLGLMDRFLEETQYTFHSMEQIISALKLKGDCEFYIKNYEKASKIWMLLFNQNYLKPDHPRFFSILEDIIKKCEERKLKRGLYFLLILLNQYRQSGNLEKTDETYYKLAKIYRANKESDHLIKIYQSHIAVKEKLDDDTGQIQLLDYLGKLYYHQGNAENSKKCYKQRMILEKRLEKQPEKPA